MYYNGLHHDQIMAKDGPIQNGIERNNQYHVVNHRLDKNGRNGGPWCLVRLCQVRRAT